MTAATLGHNGPPADIDQGWVDYRHALMVAIRDDKSLSPRARILGVMVCTYMDQDGTGARPSMRTLADVTGFGVNTIAKIMALVEEAGWMRIKRGSRKVGTTYETAQSYEDAIATYVKGARGRYANTVTKQDEPLSPPESDKTKESVTSRSDKHPVMSPSRGDKQSDKGGFVTDGKPVLSPDATVLSPDATLLSPPGSDRRIEEQKNKKESPQTPLGGASDDMPAHVQPVADWNMAFEHDDAGGVVLDAAGNVRLVNGTRQVWLDRFGGDAEALDLALIEAAGSIQPNSKKPLKYQIERQLARMVRDTRDKDRRYAKAVADNGKSAPRRRGNAVLDLCAKKLKGEDDVEPRQMKTIAGTCKEI